MPFDTAKGFIPSTVTENINYYFETFKAEYGQPNLTADAFSGSKEYELFYTAAQVDAQNQSYFSETFEKLKDYIRLKNEKIVRPTPINDRIIDFFTEKYGFSTSVRQPTLETRGILAICIDYTPDGSVLDAAIAADLLKFCVVGGIWTDGAVSKITNSRNGQPWDMQWAIPTEKTATFKYTIIRSRNSAISELPIIDIRKLFLENFKQRNALGLDIEPQKYLTKSDLPWASSIVGERMIAGVDESFTSSVYKAVYTDKFTADLDVDQIFVVDA